MESDQNGSSRFSRASQGPGARHRILAPRRDPIPDVDLVGPTALLRTPLDQAIYRQCVLLQMLQQVKKDQRIDELNSHDVIFLDKRAAEDQSHHPQSADRQAKSGCEAQQ